MGLERKQRYIFILLVSLGFGRYLMNYTPMLSSYVRFWYLGPFPHVFVNESRLYQMKFEFVRSENVRVLEFGPGQWKQGAQYGYFVRQAAVNALTSSAFSGAHRGIGNIMNGYLCGERDSKTGIIFESKPSSIRILMRPDRAVSYQLKRHHLCYSNGEASQ